MKLHHLMQHLRCYDDQTVILVAKQGHPNVQSLYVRNAFERAETYNPVSEFAEELSLVEFTFVEKPTVLKERSIYPPPPSLVLFPRRMADPKKVPFRIKEIISDILAPEITEFEAVRRDDAGKHCDVVLIRLSLPKGTTEVLAIDRGVYYYDDTTTEAKLTEWVKKIKEIELSRP